MKKQNAFGGFFLFAIFSAIFYFFYYLITHDKFSEKTKDNYDEFVSSCKTVGQDIKRAYTSIGDKKAFEKSSKSLKRNSTKLFQNTQNLCKEAGGDIHNFLTSDDVNEEKYEEGEYLD